MTETPQNDPLALDRRELVASLVLARGDDAMAFAAVESDMRHWFDADPPDGTGACVAYVETPGAWVAACGPLICRPPEAQNVDAERERAALRFTDAARAIGKRACFFAAEHLSGEGMARQLIGEQPLFIPHEWLGELPGRRRLREQLRRARAKGVVVRAPGSAELDEGTLLRAAVERLAHDWLLARPMEPMGFLVALEPFHFPARHRYFVAERDGRLVGFLSAVPIGARDAWLVEDIVRSLDAPNGTTESLLLALMRAVDGSAFVTLGLTPLSGPVAWPLRAARWVSRPLFDFQGLRAFRERLRPHAWEPVYLVYPRGQPAAVAVLDSLRAFARGSLVVFGARSIVKHPSGIPWALALPLPLWVILLAGMEATHEGALLGFRPLALGLWTAFDAVLLVVLVRAALRPQRWRLVLATSLALGDAGLSTAHLAHVGFGPTSIHALFRVLATLAPAAGAALLAWATTRTVPWDRSGPAGRTGTLPRRTGQS